MNRINPRKLKNSKWTAVEPKNKEKHFLVSDLEFDEDGTVTLCIIQAVMTRSEREIDWRERKDPARWSQGWT